MTSDGNILSLSSLPFSRLLFFLIRLCTEFETNAAAGSGCQRKDKNKREAWEREKKKVAASDSFINLTLNYLLHFTCVCVCDVCRQWNRDNVRKRQWNGKDNKSDRLIWLYERATITLSLSLCSLIEFEWRVSHLNISPSSFVRTIILICVFIRTGTTSFIECVGVFESDITYEGQMNSTQQEYNLLGQRVVCQ